MEPPKKLVGGSVFWVFPLQNGPYNDQNEANLHNVEKKFFDRLVGRLTILFVIVATVLVFLKKNFLYGIKTPNVAIICAFAITPFYIEYNNFFALDFYHILYIPIIALLVFSIKEKNKKQAFISAITLAVAILLPAIHSHFDYLFPAHKNSANEYREFLFATCCFFYSTSIFRGIKDFKFNSE